MNAEHPEGRPSAQAPFSPDQLSASAQRNLALAQDEARAFFHNYIGTDISF